MKKQMSIILISVIVLLIFVNIFINRARQNNTMSTNEISYTSDLSGISDNYSYDLFNFADSFNGYCLISDIEGFVYEWDIAERLPPKRIDGLSNISVVATAGRSSDGHSLALDRDGNVFAWGDNSGGQLGVSEMAYTDKPVKIDGLDDVRDISAFYNRSYALKNDGSLWVWGGGSFERTKLDLEDIYKFSAGSHKVVTLKTDGTVWEIDPYYNEVTKINNIENAVYVYTQSDFTVAITEDYSVYLWEWSDTPDKYENFNNYLALSDYFMLKKDGTVWFRLQYPYIQVEGVADAVFMNHKIVVDKDGYAYYITREDNETFCANKLLNINNTEEECYALMPYPDVNFTGTAQIPPPPDYKKRISTYEAIPPIYDNANNFSEGLAVVNKSDRFGFIDKDGNEIVPLIYDLAGSFSEGLAFVKKDNKFGFIDKNGKTVIPFMFDSAGQFREGLARVRIDDKFGFIDKTGELVIPCSYDFALSFSEGLCGVQNNYKWGFIDKEGKMVIPQIYDHDYSTGYMQSYYFADGVAPVYLELWGRGFIDKTGNKITPVKYSAVGAFTEGMAVVSSYDSYKMGIVDKSGEMILADKYDFISISREGLITASTNGKSYVMDMDFNVLLSLDYDYIMNFNNGVAPVIHDDSYGLIDNTGKEICAPIFRSINGFSEGLGSFVLNENIGFLNTTGKLAAPPIYDVSYMSASYEDDIEVGGSPDFVEGMAMIVVGGEDFFDSKYGFLKILEWR